MNRREFTKLAATGPLLAKAQQCDSLQYSGGLTDIPGIQVGHFTHDQRPTGCTVILTEKGVRAGVDVRGSAPGTRETDLLHPLNTVQEIHALLLSGGSAFGLDAAAGVVRYLEERNVGYETGIVRVPIVPAAILFDLGLGNPKIRPDRDSAYEACRAANSGPVQEGNVGAGAGATVGKSFGMTRAMKGGLGSALVQVGALKVACLAVVNSLGCVIDPGTGSVLAGVLSEDRTAPLHSMDLLLKSSGTSGQSGQNTTLAVVATNAAFDKAEINKVAQMGQDGLARAINPAHTPFDGDTVFSLSTGEIKGVDLGLVGALAAEATSAAIVRGVLKATSLPGIPAACDLE